MEVTWGWVLWDSGLAAFNAQPMSCKEGRCQVELLDMDTRESLHTKECVFSILCPLPATHQGSHAEGFFLVSFLKPMCIVPPFPSPHHPALLAPNL